MKMGDASLTSLCAEMRSEPGVVGLVTSCWSDQEERLGINVSIHRNIPESLVDIGS